MCPSLGIAVCALSACEGSGICVPLREPSGFVAGVNHLTWRRELRHRAAPGAAARSRGPAWHRYAVPEATTEGFFFFFFSKINLEISKNSLQFHSSMGFNKSLCGYNCLPSSDIGSFRGPRAASAPPALTPTPPAPPSLLASLRVNAAEKGPSWVCPVRSPSQVWCAVKTTQVIASY